MSETYTGNNIAINKLTDSKVKIIPFGKVKQETRKGYQLFDASKIESTTSNEVNLKNNGDGSFTISGTVTKGDYHNLSSQKIYCSDLKLGNIYINCPETFPTFSLQIYKSDGSWANYATPTVHNPFVITQEMMDEGYYIMPKFQTGKDREVSQTTIYPMVYQEGDGTFETYGAATPTPENESPIETVGQNGSVEIEVCNKNLFDWEKSFAGWIESGVVRKDGELGLKDNIVSDYIIVKENMELILNTKQYHNIAFYDKNKNIISCFEGVTNASPFITPVGTKYLAFCISHGKNETVDFAKSVQLEESSVATDYIPHESYTKVLPVQQELLDGDYFDLNSKEEVHTWEKYVLDGSNDEQWVKESLYFMCDKINDIQLSLDWIYSTPPLNYIMSNVGVQDYQVLDNQTGYGLALAYYIRINLEKIDATKNGTVEELRAYLAKNPITIYVKRKSEKRLICTVEQTNILDELDNIKLYDDINYINGTSYSLDPTLQVTVQKMIEDYDIYISADGYLIDKKSGIKYLIDLYESDIMSMPEATESSVRGAGRDGDIVLATTYEPKTFNIVCYTEDNLSPQEKVKEENKINKFLNSIKNKTIPLAIEKGSKFYNVKYSGAMITNNYPKHLKFSIPLKSSESYAKDLVEKSITGNNTGESNTIEKVGALFIINGPALNPIISLNDYSMEYNTSILEGARIEIDSNKSTITHINPDGIKTNVMKYYNHQFPKIENGINTLKVLSGIDNDMYVQVKWNDLKI